jgi:hypothetical protein
MPNLSQQAELETETTTRREWKPKAGTDVEWLSKVPVSEPDTTFGDEEGAVGRKVRVLEQGMLLGDFCLATHQALMTRKFSTTNRVAIQAACYRSEGERLDLNGDYSLRFRKPNRAKARRPKVIDLGVKNPMRSRGE